jgi:hypothetical protein
VAHVDLVKFPSRFSWTVAFLHAEANRRLAYGGLRTSHKRADD